MFHVRLLDSIGTLPFLNSIFFPFLLARDKSCSRDLEVTSYVKDTEYEFIFNDLPFFIVVLICCFLFVFFACLCNNHFSNNRANEFIKVRILCMPIIVHKVM